MKKTTDGTGTPLDRGALYYVQDTRSIVGNCGSWWAPNGAGYVCSIDEAGKYTGAYVADHMSRETDVAWPVEYVEQRTVRHCRVDNQAFERRDDDQPKYEPRPRAKRRQVW